MTTAASEIMGSALLQIVEMSLSSMALLDHEYRFVYANRRACLLLGSSAEQLMGRDFLVGFPPSERTALAEGLGSDTSTHWSSVHAAAGRERAIEYEVRAHATPGEVLLILALRDVTEKRSARAGLPQNLTRAELCEREDQYLSIFEATNDGMLIVDLDGYIVEANSAVCEMYGYSYDEFIGLHADAFTHPDFRQDSAEALHLMQRGETLRSRGPNIRKDGSTFHVEARGTRYTYRGEAHTLAVVRDVTEQVQQYEILERRVEERTRELSTLLEVSRSVGSTLQLQPLLGLILDNLRTIVTYTGSSILVVDGEDLVFLQSRGPEDEEYVVGHRYPVAAFSELWELISRGEPVVIHDVRSADPTALAFRGAVGADMSNPNFSYIRSWLGAPLKIKDRVSGVLSLSSDRPAAYSGADAELVMALANQAAVAIENARLYERAQQVAVLEERQRLARELHDSVSQVLYSIGLGAQTARALVGHEPARAIGPLDYVVSLAQNGMAEMRGLLFELRPESLEEEGLVQALQKQTAALAARHEVVIDTALCAEPDVGGAVKEALYRIAQEALHNIVKHAKASETCVSLECTDAQVVLEIRDNGAGFDPRGAFPGHLGLHSMRERAGNLGGALEVESAPGAGTRLRAWVPSHAGATL